MMSRRFGLMHREQGGLTLVELMIAIALVGIVTAGITTTISHVFAGSTRTSNHMTAVRQVQSAGYWVSRDALQAREVDTDSEFLKLTWTEIQTGYEYEVTYCLIDMPSGDLKSLRRSVKITPPGESSTTTVSLVAQHIDRYRTSCEPEDKTLIFTVTATVGGQTESRVYRVTPRIGG